MSYTINPNAKNRWARNADNTMDLSLETDASSVYLDNGRTLEQEIGEGSMVSNVATVDNAMSKIIDGTLDGAYESLVFKGKSLVNIHPISYTISASGATTYFAGRDIDKTKIKSGTRYFLRLLDTDPTVCRAYFKPCNVNTISFADINDKYAIFTTKSELTDSDFNNNKIHFYTNTSKTLEDVANTKIILCEYQDGMENWDIPYFEGICDVKMPILRNTGKNLFDGELIRGNISGGSGEDINNAGFESKMCRTNYIKVTPGSNFTASIEGKYVIEKISQIDKDKKFIATTEKNIPSVSIKLSNNTSFIRCVIKSSDSSEITLDDVRNSNIQFEESPTKTTYEPHKSNILRTSEEIVLREVGGVQDTYNPLTGEYVKRIGEVVITSAVAKSVIVLDKNVRANITMSALNGDSGTTKANNILSDKFYWSEANARDIEGLRVNGNTLHWCVSRDKLTSQDLQGVNTWLQSNPITVQYILAEPITTIIKPSTMTPFAYQNGHVIVESGYEGQSLLPTLEYSTVINKTGLVENVAKTIQRQEKQLTMLEQMLIQNIINLDYNNTLLALKNEMEEML